MLVKSYLDGLQTQKTSIMLQITRSK
jgi:hypothetical protein